MLLYKDHKMAQWDSLLVNMQEELALVKFVKTKTK